MHRCVPGVLEDSQVCVCVSGHGVNSVATGGVGCPLTAPSLPVSVSKCRPSSVRVLTAVLRCLRVPKSVCVHFCSSRGK